LNSGDKKRPEQGLLPGRVKVFQLPTEVCEGLVGLGHFVNIVALADGSTLALVGLHDLGCERLAHGRTFPGIGEIHDPAQGQGGLAVRRNLQRHLIGGATHAARLVSMRGLALSTARCKISTGLLAGFFSDNWSKAP
jgi:hypothetical protein